VTNGHISGSDYNRFRCNHSQEVSMAGQKRAMVASSNNPFGVCSHNYIGFLLASMLQLEGPGLF
jgi:hypothetical protein